MSPVTAVQALSALARDAIVSSRGPLGHRWCSMERCGNRAKTRSYRRRQGA